MLRICAYDYDHATLRLDAATDLEELEALSVTPVSPASKKLLARAKRDNVYLADLEPERYPANSTLFLVGTEGARFTPHEMKYLEDAFANAHAYCAQPNDIDKITHEIELNRIERVVYTAAAPKDTVLELQQKNPTVQVIVCSSEF
jgi:hypothetical protein